MHVRRKGERGKNINYTRREEEKLAEDIVLLKLTCSVSIKVLLKEPFKLFEAT